MSARRAIVFGIALLLPAGVAGAGGGTESSARPSAADRAEVRDRWGVEPVAVRRTMDGRTLDFRYRVLDAVKARPLFDRTIKPVLLDQAAGAALGVPEDSKLGALRASVRNPPVAGKQYYVLFANPLGRVKGGDRVTVVIGECRLPDLVVE